MADLDRSFPSLAVRPGEYTVDWHVGSRRRFTGAVTLAPRRRPQLELRGRLRRPRKNAAGELVWAMPGKEVSYRRLVGTLPSNEEIVVIEPSFNEWFPELFQGSARWGIVGLDIASVPTDSYERVSFQITDTDLWLGAAPLAEVTWPRRKNDPETYSATLNPSAHRIWRDTRNGLTVEVGYDHSFSLDPYRFGLTPAPTFGLWSRKPLTLDEWAEEWLAPLIDLASIATKRPQTLSWLTVQHGTAREQRSGTVFGRGIHQEPYAAHYDEEWRRFPELQPLFTLARLSVTPMRLVRTWRTLQKSNEPFVELYRAALYQPDLPPRARFLHLIQALEARHTFASMATDAKAQASFESRRAGVIREVEELGLVNPNLRFLKDEWSKQRRDSLERRLISLLHELPQSTRQRIDGEQKLQPVRTDLLKVDEHATTFQAQLRVLRNKLSHGERNYPDHELQPWVAAVETICQAQLLRLLGFRLPEIEASLRG